MPATSLAMYYILSIARISVCFIIFSAAASTLDTVKVMQERLCYNA